MLFILQFLFIITFKGIESSLNPQRCFIITLLQLVILIAWIVIYLTLAAVAYFEVVLAMN